VLSGNYRLSGFRERWRARRGDRHPAPMPNSRQIRQMATPHRSRFAGEVGAADCAGSCRLRVPRRDCRTPIPRPTVCAFGGGRSWVVKQFEARAGRPLGPQCIRESKICLSCPPVNQWVLRQEATWGPKYALRKAVNQVNGTQKDARNGRNTGFSGLARPRSDSRCLPFGSENVGAAGSESPFVSSGQAFG
jgi:hypothetical protein